MYLLDPEVQAQFADLSAGFRAAACSLSEDGSALKRRDRSGGWRRFSQCFTSRLFCLFKTDSSSPSRLQMQRFLVVIHSVSRCGVWSQLTASQLTRAQLYLEPWKESDTHRERDQSASCIHLGDQLFSYWSYISRYISPIWFMLKVITRSNFTHDVMKQRVWCMFAECWCL